MGNPFPQGDHSCQSWAASVDTRMNQLTVLYIVPSLANSFQSKTNVRVLLSSWYIQLDWSHLMNTYKKNETNKERELKLLSVTYKNKRSLKRTFFNLAIHCLLNIYKKKLLLVNYFWYCIIVYSLCLDMDNNKFCSMCWY